MDGGSPAPGRDRAGELRGPEAEGHRAHQRCGRAPVRYFRCRARCQLRGVGGAEQSRPGGGRAAMTEALLNRQTATLTRKVVEPMRLGRWTSADLPTP